MNKFYWNEDTLHDMLYTKEEGVYSFCHDNTDWNDTEDLEDIIEDFTKQLRKAEDDFYSALCQTKHSDLCEAIVGLRKQLANN
jgi:hypothetical protein